DKWRGWPGGARDNQQGEHQQYQNHRDEPVQLARPQKLQQFAQNTHLCQDTAHDVSPCYSGLRTRNEFRTSMSIWLLLKVLKASSGEVTIGSPRRLNEVFSTTGTPVA